MIVISLDLLAMLLVRQPTMLLASFAARQRCWLMFCLCPPGPSGPFFHRATPQALRPQPVTLRGVRLSQAQDLAFVLVEFLEVPVSLFLLPV